MNTAQTPLIAVITGAAGGLGAALCKRFARTGYRIAALDRSAVPLMALADEMRAQGTEVLALPCDITDDAACAAAIADIVATWGGLDLLINNAGISHRSAFEHTAPAVIRQVMNVNFFGAVHCTHAALPYLLARRGQVVAISSVAGFAPLIARTGYAASKHALHGFFDSLRSEVEDRGVSVLIACPSFIRTGIDAAALGGDGDKAAAPRQVTGEESSPEEIAERIFDAVAARRRLLLPSRTARLAWWISRLLPVTYSRLMKKRVGAELANDAH